MLRLAVDTTFAGVNATGVGRYSRQLVAALQSQNPAPPGPPLRVEVFGPSAHKLPDQHTSKLVRARNTALENPLATQAWLPLRLGPCRPHVVHSTAFVGPLWGPGRLVLTFPDLIYHHYPADYNPIWRYVIEQLAPRSLRRARAVIALSRYTAEDLVRTYHVDRRKIYVVPAAVDAPFFAPRAPHEVQRIQAAYGLTAPYLLHCGALVRRKNLPLLIRAFGRYCATSGETDTQLALTGRAAPGMPGSDDLLAVLAESPVRGRIHLLGQVPAEHLPALYTGATLVVYPSLFEGQGLPPLEAMAAGTPVLASTTPAVAEATGSAAMLVEPNDEAAWANALGRLLSDAALRADLARRGRTVAAAFTWPRTAADTCTVYRTVLGSRGFSR